MPTQYPFGKPYPRAIDPIPSGIANGRGLYRWSAFYAPLTYIAPGKGENPSTSLQAYAPVSDPGPYVDLLLFTSDLPVIAQAYVRGSETGRFNIQPIENLLTLPAAFIGDAPEGLTQPVVLSNYGQVLKGYTAEKVIPIATPGVAVSGFPARVYGSLLGPLSTPVIDFKNETVTPVTETPQSIAVLCIANGAVASGVVGYSFCDADNTAVTNAPTPIILQASQYTQEIKDNDNLCVAGNGDLGQVVGLFYSFVD